MQTFFVRVIAALTGASIAWAAGSAIYDSSNDPRHLIVNELTQITHSIIIEDVVFDEVKDKHYVDIILTDRYTWDNFSRSESRTFSSNIYKIADSYYGQDAHVRIVYDDNILAQIWWNNGLNYATDQK